MSDYTPAATGTGARARPAREPIAASRNGGERALSQHLAQRRYLHLEVVLLHYQSGPDERQQVVLRDQLSGSPHEHDQQVERARAERDRLPVREQAPLGGLQLEAAETVRIPILVSRGCVVQSWLPRDGRSLSRVACLGDRETARFSHNPLDR